MFLKWMILCSLWAARLVRQPSPPVLVSSGLLSGSISPDGSYIRYFGVPYATAERFQTPKPAPNWEGVFHATNEHIRCAQRFSRTWITGYEDCLTLNIYTPLKKRNKPYPVMVYIHGGGFRDGSGSPILYGPEYLLKHDVILVTLNYRLEVLGFLCLGLKEAPGNMGLKDQVEALRWVKRNIQAFGGDPDNVTLFGESAGSASVLYHIVSPMSTGLFHKAIMQSGSAMSPWSLQFEPKETAFKLAKQMKENVQDVSQVLKVFKSKSIEELLSTRVPRAKGDTVLSENIFVPCIEDPLPESENFITDSPYNLVTTGQFNKVPVILGYNSAEGLMFVGKENTTTISTFDFINSMPRDLIFPSNDERETTALRLQELYFKDLYTTMITNSALAKYEGDAGLVYPVIATADLLMKNMEEPVYIYKFCRDGWMNLVKILFGFAKYPGATHADELFYIFKYDVTLPMSLLEFRVVDTMTTLWTNFAKYSNPTPYKYNQIMWESSKSANPKVLVIDKTLSVTELWEDKAILFWNETYTKYRRKSK